MKKLIAYFSWSGNPEKLVSSINKELNIDTISIERKIPYSEDYEECAYKEVKEEVAKKIHPLIKNLELIRLIMMRFSYSSRFGGTHSQWLLALFLNH